MAWPNESPAIAKKVAALRVDRALETLNLGPLAVSRHRVCGVSIKSKLPGQNIHERIGMRRARKRMTSEEAR